jgi:hypothetical protein
VTAPAYKAEAEARARAHAAARQHTQDLADIIETSLRAAMPEAEVTRQGDFVVRVGAGGVTFDVRVARN